jgi:hypothetical protein
MARAFCFIKRSDAGSVNISAERIELNGSRISTSAGTGDDDIPLEPAIFFTEHSSVSATAGTVLAIAGQKYEQGWD